MSPYNQRTQTPPGECLPPAYDPGFSYWDDAIYSMTVAECEDPSFGYGPPDIPLEPIYMEELFAPDLSPLNTHQSSPFTLCEEALWLPESEFGDNSPDNYFSFSSQTASPVDTPTSSTLSSGDQTIQTPDSLELSSPPPATPPAASPPPASPRPEAPEPTQNSDGTWACPEIGCTHPGHKRRCDARKHHKSHTKPYRCRVNGCPYRSSNAKDRERHYDTRHAATRHPACPAPGCGVLKSRVDNMRDHIRRRHPGMNYRSSEISALYPRRGRH